jgi:XTP/dITP diphosphohydrolase
MRTLLLATRNAHKVQEIRSILGEGFRCVGLKDFPETPEVIEDAATFAGNAEKKAVHLARWLAAEAPRLAGTVPSLPSLVLADDSGLEVDALGGAPGVHSARFTALDETAAPPAVRAKTNSPDADNNSKLLRLLKAVPLEKRTARFRCVLALAAVPSSAEGEPRTELFEGVCEGRIAFAPSGRSGFGYDPLFVPLGYEQSFAELGEEVKNGMSHRARALEKLRERLR